MLCAISAAGFASLTILSKSAMAMGLSLVKILIIRFALAAILLWIYIAARRGRAVFPGWKITLTLLALGTFGYALQSSLFFTGLQRISASLTSLILYAYPVFVALLDWIFNRKVPTWRSWIAMVVAFAGVLLTVGPEELFSGEIGNDIVGAGAVLLGSAFYAAYLVAVARVSPRAGTLVSTAWVCAGACIGFMLVGDFLPALQGSFNMQSVGFATAMAVIGTIIPLGAIIAGMERVGPLVGSLIATLEPVFTVLLAMLLLGERLNLLQAAGGGLVLLAVILLNLPMRKSYSN
ncbi:MAG TPA: DMT family transporter [Anaerolineae bacterium]|nr:DMT family transporter [Anaerolineae bacterium]